jgi:hypothetical protein
MIGAAAKVLLGLIIGIVLLIAVLFALGTDVMAHDIRPKLARRARPGRVMVRRQEAHV